MIHKKLSCLDGLRNLTSISSNQGMPSLLMQWEVFDSLGTLLSFLLLPVHLPAALEDQEDKDRCENRRDSANDFEPPHGDLEETKLGLHVALDWCSNHWCYLTPDHAKSVNDRIGLLQGFDTCKKRENKDGGTHFAQCFGEIVCGVTSKFEL